MYGDINVYEMKMPAHYVDMTADEMEYGGSGLFDDIANGFQNFSDDFSRKTSNMIQNWNWDDYNNSVIEGAVIGAGFGLLYGACTGPGAIVGCAFGALSGAGGGAVSYMYGFYK